MNKTIRISSFAFIGLILFSITGLARADQPIEPIQVHLNNLRSKMMGAGDYPFGEWVVVEGFKSTEWMETLKTDAVSFEFGESQTVTYNDIFIFWNFKEEVPVTAVIKKAYEHQSDFELSPLTFDILPDCKQVREFIMGAGRAPLKFTGDCKTLPPGPIPGKTKVQITVTAHLTPGQADHHDQDNKDDHSDQDDQDDNNKDDPNL